MAKKQFVTYTNFPYWGLFYFVAYRITGFLATVLGMIQAFMTIAQETHQVSPKMLSGGIYEAMITTAAGLIVGITANLGYNYLLVQVQKATQRIEHASNEFIALVESYPATAQPNNKPNEAAQ